MRTTLLQTLYQGNWWCTGMFVWMKINLNMHMESVLYHLKESTITFMPRWMSLTMLVFLVRNWKNTSTYFPLIAQKSQLTRSMQPDHATSETLKILNDISAWCDLCQWARNVPKCFCFLFRAKIVSINENILTHVTYINGSPVLHNVDNVTKFPAAKIQTGTTVKNI